MNEPTKDNPKIEVTKIADMEKPFEWKQITTKELKKMKHKDLVTLADQMATRLMWLHSTGKESEETYIRLASELYHVSEIIDWSKEEKNKKPKVNYGK
jgi:hypothetical protein